MDSTSLDEQEELRTLVLQCAAHSTRPLRLLELADAINVTTGRDLNMTKEAIRAICKSSPAELTPQDTVCPSRSVSPLDGNHLESGVAHGRLALLCIAYMTSGFLDTLKAPIPSLMNLKIPESFPFATYSVTSWAIHVKQAAEDGFSLPALNTALDGLLTGENPAKLAAVSKIKMPHYARREKDAVTAVDLSSVLGFVDYTRHLLEKPGVEIPPDLPDYLGYKGDAALMDIFISHGMNLHGYSNRGWTPLHAAAAENHSTLVSRLLEAGADPFLSSEPDKRFCGTSSDTRQVAASVACRRGHLDTVMVLLDYIDRPRKVNLMLGWAVDGGHVDTVKHILQHPDADANFRRRYTTPLYNACCSRNPDVIGVLLACGANPSILHQPPRGMYRPKGLEERRGATALHALAAWGDVYTGAIYSGAKHGGDGPGGSIHDRERSALCFRLILEAGADVHQLDGHDCTPLHYAVDGVAVRSLTDAGADTDALNHWHETILHTSRDSRKRTEVILTALDLIGTRANLNVACLPGRLTPLLLWIDHGHVDIALELLRLGADATVVDKRGNGAFHHVVNLKEGKAKPLIQPLISAGADINLANRDGQTAIHCLVGDRSFRSGPVSAFAELLTVLIEAGVDLEKGDFHGQTPLFSMVQSRSFSPNDAKNAFRILIAAGAYPETMDSQGRTLLHACVPRLQVDFLDYLVGLGVKPDVVDSNGNTLWHELASYCISREGISYPSKQSVLEIFRRLAALGIDPRQPNYSGRTPLHILSHVSPPQSDWGPTRCYQALLLIRRFDELLEKFEDVDPVDCDGFTPLHLASARCEHHVSRLLESGADPTKSTNEGLTPLHIAAQAARENVLAALLEHLRLNMDDEQVTAVVNKRDAFQRTCLYYACTQGKIETVQRLIEAGVCVSAYSYAGSCWQACTEFEAAMAKAQQESRESWKSTTSGPRLDDIVRLLAAHDPSSRMLDIATQDAASKDLDYTVDCLVRVRDESYTPAGQVLACLERRRTKLAELDDSKTPFSLHFDRTWEDQDLIRLRQKLLETDFAKLDVKDKSILFLNKLAETGYTFVLSQVATPEFLVRLDDKVTGVNRKWRNQSLLMSACLSEAPNMGTVRFLVEGLGGCPMSTNQEMVDLDEPVDPVLHCLVRGGHWWQLREALPYLLAHGADIDARDENRKTPLHIAIEESRSAKGNTKIIKAVLDLGADPNALSGTTRGTLQTCLSYTADNPAAVRLLMSHGAVATQRDICMAITRDQRPLLKAMLEGGANPNTRYNHPDLQSKYRFSGDVGVGGLSEEELYPIHYAACEARRAEVMEGLLDHGADPTARYEEKGTTIMHLLLRRGIGPQIFFDAPGLNLEKKDESGSTLLLAACDIDSRNHGNPPGDTILRLLDGGADIRARDNHGRNVLHYIHGHLSAMKRIITSAPELVAQQDEEGNTPLQLALRRASNRCRHRDRLEGGEISALLDAGADVKLANHQGETPMHLLFRCCWFLKADGTVEQSSHRDLLFRLIGRGADVNARNRNGETPIFYFFSGAEVAKDGEERAPRRRQARGEMPQNTSREGGLYELFEQIWVDWGVTSTEGTTLLHVVAGRGCPAALERFKFLLGKGHDPKTEDHLHRTPLDVAALAQPEDVLASLYDPRISGVDESANS